jgi:hypothetical protein
MRRYTVYRFVSCYARTNWNSLLTRTISRLGNASVILAPLLKNGMTIDDDYTCLDYMRVLVSSSSLVCNATLQIDESFGPGTLQKPMSGLGRIIESDVPLGDTTVLEQDVSKYMDKNRHTLWFFKGQLCCLDATK